MSSLAELEASLASTLQETEAIMTQTFRARGAKLERLTAKLEELDATTRDLEQGRRMQNWKNRTTY